MNYADTFRVCHKPMCFSFRAFIMSFIRIASFCIFQEAVEGEATHLPNKNRCGRTSWVNFVTRCSSACRKEQQQPLRTQIQRKSIYLLRRHGQAQHAFASAFTHLLAHLLHVIWGLSQMLKLNVRAWVLHLRSTSSALLHFIIIVLLN